MKKLKMMMILPMNKQMIFLLERIKHLTIEIRKNLFLKSQHKKESSPMKELVEQGEHKSKRKIKKLKDKIKTFKVLERFLKNENELLKERNHTLISKNEKLKEDKDQLQEEHELVCHQAYLWNKSRKAL